MERGMNVLALVKGTERYVFLYDDESHRALLQAMGRFAADADLSFTWYDAAVPAFFSNVFGAGLRPARTNRSSASRLPTDI